MPCTTLLVGRKASYDGSTVVGRNDDSPSGQFVPKKWELVTPENQPKLYRSVLSHVEIPLPEEPLPYTRVSDAVPYKGIWGACGSNTCQVAMSATETLTTNERVLAADPLVELNPAIGVPEDPNYVAEKPGGIGEEDMVVLVLPYIRSAREGVLRLGALLEQYGTYENNGIAFQDSKDIWWLETIGGHHWIARRVPEDCYVTMPNQLGLDSFDLEDAFGAQIDHLCSSDLREWIEKNHLNLSLDGKLNPRQAFGSHSDMDHVYNTPRAWIMQRYLNPKSNRWDGLDAEYTPLSDDIPWCRRPEWKITLEDVKAVLSNHFQGTPYDPYDRHAPKELRGMYRPIGINRTGHLDIVQIRPTVPEVCQVVHWLCLGSNVFNGMAPFFMPFQSTPDYLYGTTNEVSTDSFYWANRLIAALADAHFNDCLPHINRYQQSLQAFGHRLIDEATAHVTELLLSEKNQRIREEDLKLYCESVNEAIAIEVKKKTQDLLSKVLYESSCRMNNAYSLSDT